MTNPVTISGPVEISGTTSVSGDLSVTNVVTTKPIETLHDAFGRLRVANPYTLFEFTSIHPFDLSHDLKFDISLIALSYHCLSGL